jgi:hypothetical protein
MAASVILLFISDARAKKAAWILALVSALIFLFNMALVPTNPGYVWGSYISSVVALMWKDYTLALLQLTRSIIPLMIGIFSLIELTNYKNDNLDRNISIIFIGFFCFSLFAEKFIKHMFGFGQLIEPSVYSLIIIIAFFLWGRTK